MDKKKIYFLIICIVLSLGIIGATYAYFTAQASDDVTVHGDAAATTFGLKVERVTTVDMAFGLVPMANNQAPGAAQGRCYDIYGNAGCQLYRITVDADSDTVMFLDGYVATTKEDGVDTRIAAVYTDDEEDSFYTAFDSNDFIDRDDLSSSFLDHNDKGDLGIKTGERGEGADERDTFTHDDDGDCLLFSNQKIGGDAGNTRVFYMMIWVYDNGRAQNELQGMQLAYHGSVTFVTAQGNEISASFD